TAPGLIVLPHNVDGVSGHGNRRLEHDRSLRSTDHRALLVEVGPRAPAYANWAARSRGQLDHLNRADLGRRVWSSGDVVARAERDERIAAADDHHGIFKDRCAERE